MNYLVRSIALVILLCVMLGCSEAAGDAEVSLEAVIDTVSRSARSTDTEVSRNITPSTYKIALTYFALIRKDGAVIPIIDEETAVVYDFSGHFIDPPLLLGKKRIPIGEYTGYEMRFTYLEMDLECSFSVPAWSPDASHTLVTSTHDETDSSILQHQLNTIRLYFNTDENYYKRDMVVKYTTDEGPEWAWMRRELEDSEGNRTFFLHTVTHPAVGIIDLFSNEDFWGSADDYDNPDTKITIRSGSTTGGLDATMESFRISATSKIILTINIADSFNFWEDTDDLTYGNNNKLDFGPTYDEIPIGSGPIAYYGDKGFHPFMPSFNLVKMP
ncbi:MAG: hypothetical protein GX626_02765 [Spirochaetales bacterium]|jgi:hypothetical protein|nr:hypothetical protein [Spirochaetales bacterium]